MQATAGAAGSKFTLPVASKGLQNWAAVIGRMCTAANQDSTACLNEYFNRTNGMLDGLVSTSDPLICHPHLAYEDILVLLTQHDICEAPVAGTLQILL